MMKKLNFDYSKTLPFLDKDELSYLQDYVKIAHDRLHNKTGPGNEYLGWVDLPVKANKNELERIKTAAGRIRDKSDTVLVLGIGGSYLGAKAAVEALSHSFFNILPKGKRNNCPQVYFAGHNASMKYVSDLLDVLEDREVSLIIISKSGTTLETAVASRIFREFMEKRYGKEEARKRIYAITDPKDSSALKKLAAAQGYETFDHPLDVGGRYSVLTVVGLLPIAAAGFDIDLMLQGAADSYQEYLAPSIEKNMAYQYAAIRNLLYKKGKNIEILVNYESSLHSVSEWWKQLFGESEGKHGKGIFPASVDLTTDLHSMGQYIQEGPRNIFETVINIECAGRGIVINKEQEDFDGLNYLAGKTVSYINKKAYEATVLAHTDGGVPNLIVSLPDISEYSFGNMVYFFEKACGISAHLLGVNPFTQPGVEAYKKNMFALLGKPGMEKERETLEKRMATCRLSPPEK